MQHKFLLLCGIISACAYGYLSLNSQHYADTSLIQMWAVCAVCSAISFTLWWHYFTLEECKNSHSPLILVALFAILFRLIGVISFPILEDDFYRYLWDGRMTIEAGSPYGIVPSTFFSDHTLPHQFEHILGLINHPDIATIYGPINQYVFALSYIIAPGEIWPLQLIYSIADLGIILLLFKLTKPSFVILYAWSPLMIKEFAFTAHPDILGIFFITLAFTLYKRQSWFWLGTFLALATGVKVFALIAAPLFLRFNWRSWCVFFTTIVLIAIPFGFKDAWVPEGLSAMASDWLFNAPLYTLLMALLPISTIKTILLSGFALIAVSYFVHLIYEQYYKRNNKVIRVDLLYGIFFLCIPVFNPWYLAWLLPFAAIFPSRWAWTASVCLLISYASGVNIPHLSLGLYQQPNWVLTTQFGIIAFALMLDIYAKSRPSKI